MKSNLHIHPSPLLNDTRIQKITEWLINRQVFDRVVVAGVDSPQLPALQGKGPRRLYVRLPRGKADNSKWLLKALAFLPWYVRVLALALRTKPVCINAHTLSVLPVAVVAKWCCGAKLVYDTHELETEVFTAVGLRKRLVKIVERLFIRFADEIVVVSGGIADWYEKTYNIPRPHVLRNVPDALVQSERGDYLRKHFSIPNDGVIALYLGAIAKGREVEDIIKAWHEAPARWHLVIVGFGPMLEECKRLAKDMTNVHFHPPVPAKQIVSVASSADLGLRFLSPGCLSHYYSLPNKLFEYLYAGLPVVSNDLPEIRKVIEEEDCGWLCDLGGMSKLFKLERDEIAGKAPAARRTAQRYQWAKEALVLKDVYEALGFYPEQHAIRK
ncbi:MAG: glycosyltransferase family 4 protein [Alphaproteobacteria bacterium]|nr:glycosyltransferase family 4 protein [Alphaproteobacteria bacterium]